MHVLVIGGSRFLGYQLVWRLLAGGHRVTLLNRGLRADPFGSRVERLKGDRTTPDFNRLVSGRQFDAAVDFTAFRPKDVRQAMAVFGEGRVGHYIFISTGQVYLVREDCPRPSRESDYQGPLLPEPANPADRDEWLYGIHKRQCEDALAEAWEKGRFPSTRLRIPMVNGERDYFRRIESYLWRILDGGPVILPDGGAEPVRHAYGGDVVKAIMGILGRPDTFGQAYNLSQDELPTLAELVAMVAELAGAPARLVPVPTADLLAAGLKPNEVSPFSERWMSSLDPSRAKAELGFQHEPLRSYLDKIVTCHLAHPAPEPPGNYGGRQAELLLAARKR